MDIRFLFIAQKGQEHNDEEQFGFTKEITALYCHHNTLALRKHLNRQSANSANYLYTFLQQKQCGDHFNANYGVV